MFRDTDSYKYKAESQRMFDMYLSLLTDDYEPDMDDIVRENASEEYKKHYFDALRHLDELEADGTMT
ncbi:MAG TPA: hypothetical protein OIM11_06940 [Coriobacteriaceae bacterium]|nr:hypothetical protein [Coriobacteriaceae bacterium]